MQRMLSPTFAASAALGLLAAAGAYAAPSGGMGGGMGGMGGMGAGSGMSGPTTRSDTTGPSASSGLKEGMTVKDSAGVTVGKITKVGKSGGAPAALVEVGGKTVVVMGSTLKVSGDTATSTQTKDEIEALPEPKPS